MKITKLCLRTTVDMNSLHLQELPITPVQPRPVGQRHAGRIHFIRDDVHCFTHDLSILVSIDATDSIIRQRAWLHGKRNLSKALIRGTCWKRQLLLSLNAPLLSALSPDTPWQGGPAPKRMRPTWLNWKAQPPTI